MSIDSDAINSDSVRDGVKVNIMKSLKISSEEANRILDEVFPVEIKDVSFVKNGKLVKAHLLKRKAK